MGLAMPLALAALSGTLLGALAPAGLFAVICVALLVTIAASRYVLAVLVLTLAVSAGQVLTARGALLPAGLAGTDVAVTARIVEASDEGGVQRLRLALKACRPLERGRPGCDRLSQARVTWYDAPPLETGETWTLTLRLRPPGGFANPHTFDYAAWLWREGIDATGYVRDVPPPRRLRAAPGSMQAQALTYLDRHVAEGLPRRWLAALSLGASERLTRGDWELLNASGTTHLMVISGLHVGLAATFMLLLSRGIARLVTPRSWRMTAWPWWSAAMATVGYAWLAGLEPPALRAMIMTLVGLWVSSGRHAPGPWQGWWLALAIILLVDPLAAWRPGLWLSFIAVGLLILAWQGRARPRGWRGWFVALLRSQCLLAPLMAAAVLFAFDRLAPAAPLINLLAVPVVGSLMVPLGLLGWLLAGVPPLAESCWALFSVLASGVHATLQAVVGWAPLWYPEPWQRLPVAGGLVLLTALWTLPGLSGSLRWVGSASLLILGLCLAPPALSEGQLRLRVQDVGQGQLIELRTARHRLLYDTGPRFGSGFMPLATLWPPGQRFDGVIVSHGDNDHAGGVAALEEDHVVLRWWGPVLASLDAPALPCRAGEGWHWDGVEFRFLWPEKEPEALASNDRSCVLLVEAGGQRLLISGDAGTAVEARVARVLEERIDVLIAGHHGSRTSSSALWVAAARPRHVIFSAGRGNPHGHPHAEVVRRFRNAGSCLWNTALDGALTLWLGRAQVIEATPQRRLPGAGAGVEGGCHAVESPP
ncbi:competence protein ComEC [Modicisalibacter ilicicola DSM 19980]|uniref:Competence protein ComEC n=1 Tax=Modicisalibacter ilicicola DSM 19980 TaxID=1121942 RepID=A0A1M5CCN1_9GAMM|nr:DNA internalization-related competence protein ComEC/Rec2 [Halomonas ilicicola]SHF52357.1 competence protein ComEC [Halomonas ilicicola DSM 19980]